MERDSREAEAARRAGVAALLQERRQGRKAAAEAARLGALAHKQEAVLRRKTEEAAAARARLKEVLLGRSALRQPCGPQTRPPAPGEVPWETTARPDWEAAEAAATVLAAAAVETAPAAPVSRMDRVPAVDIRPGATQRDANPQGEIDASWTHTIEACGYAARRA